MADPFIGQITMFGGNFAPRGWAFCDGQLLPVSSYDALFSILGTNYGGDGRTTFGLPDLRGRVPIQQGTGPGLPTYSLGQRGGTENVTLITNQIPAHNHPAQIAVNSGPGEEGSPVGQFLAAQTNKYAEEASPGATLGGNTGSSSTGGSSPHNNIQPCLVVNYIIALVGIYPSRS